MNDNSPNNIRRQLDEYHLQPTLLPLAKKLAAAMEADTILRVFETYRTPERQAHVFTTGASHARPWQSAHQYGYALDFAGFKNGAWTWDVDARCWEVLHHRAAELGLLTPISWDLGHVQHPRWHLRDY